ncbi:MAG: hypothetical protein AB8F94_16490 [Saprospiraceae bacterium]
MKLLKINYYFLALLFAVATLTSCDDDDDSTPITTGASVNVNNTFTGDAQTMGVETDIGIFFGGSAGDFIADATVSESVEFPAYLLELYDIDIDENNISFELVAPVDDPTYMDFFRTLEAGTTDRYYLTFTEAHNVNGFTSNNSSVNLRIDSDKILVVEIGEGFNFNPGSSFTITLN